MCSGLSLDWESSTPDAFAAAERTYGKDVVRSALRVRGNVWSDAAARLGGLSAPRHEDNETTLDQLKARIASTLDWLSTVPPEANTQPLAFPSWLRWAHKQAKAGRALPFGLAYDPGWPDRPRPTEHTRLVGQLSVSGIVEGSARSAAIGYWIDRQYAGRGIVPTATAMIQAGKVRPLGVTSTRRLEALPDVPPLAEVGVKDLDSFSAWFMLVAPAKTPKAIIDKLHAELRSITEDPATRQEFIRLGLIPVSSPSPDELKSFMQSEIVRWGDLVRKAGLAGTE